MNTLLALPLLLSSSLTLLPSPSPPWGTLARTSLSRPRSVAAHVRAFLQRCPRAGPPRLCRLSEALAFRLALSASEESSALLLHVAGLLVYTENKQPA